MSTYQYREGSIADLKELIQVGIDSYSEFSTVLAPAEWEKMSANLHDEVKKAEVINIARTFVCTCEGKIIGVAYFVPHGNPTPIYEQEWCYLRMVGVHPQHRGKGIARKLTQLCIDRAKQTNEKIMMLHTSEMMDAARHIYEGLGFKVYKDIGLIFGKQYWLYKLDL